MVCCPSAMGAVDIEKLVQPGEVLAGKYRIERILGQGGMGVVVAAHHLQLDERVAIKFLLPDAVNRQDLIARFEREARAAVKIKSVHVARVIDVGVLDTGSPYMVMEYLEGVDLAARLEQTGPLSVQETSDFVLQASEAIVEAHALGIVHRDLKPANLFCIRGADGLASIKVLDFGISKLDALGGSGGLTQTSSMLGSPFYMSPEQMQSAKNVDMRTDIWALGVILYQCVTGLMPFRAETLPELVLKIVTEPLAPLLSVRPDIPPAFEQVVTRCLEKDRDRRYQHIGELAQDLVQFAPERGRASAERIMRVIMTSGLAGQVALSPSSRNVPVPQTTQHITQSPVTMPRSGSSPALASSNTAFIDSQSRHPHPSYVTGPSAAPPYVTPMGPPPGTPPPGSSGPPAGMPGFGVTTGGFGNTNPGAGAPAKWIVLGVVGSLVIAAVALCVGFVVKGRIDATKLASSATASVSVSAPPPPPPTVAAIIVPAEPLAVVDAGAEATHDAGVAAVPTPVQNVPMGLPSSRKLTPAKDDCSVKFYFDKKGNKIYKPDCL